jgi:hypothetical protein
MSSDDETFVGDSEGSEQFFDASPVPPKPQPLFPTLSRPIHVDPAALASVPEPAQGCVILDPTSKLNALEAYDEGAMLFLQDPAAPPSDFTDPYVYPRLTKNERCVSSYSFSFESCPPSHGITQRSTDCVVVLHPGHSRRQGLPSTHARNPRTAAGSNSPRSCHCRTLG